MNQHRFFFSALLVAGLTCFSSGLHAAFSLSRNLKPETDEVSVTNAVTVREDRSGFTLANGVVIARVDKQSGRLESLKYRGLELLGHGGGYWSFAGRVTPGSRVSAFVRVDPATNGGDLAEITCRYATASDAPGQNLDVDYRYALRRGAGGVYATAVFHHEPGHAQFGAGEGRFAMKLNPEVFDYMTIDANRRRVMPSGADWDKGLPLNMKEARRMTTGIHKGEAEHKYDYSAVLAETPAYGWSSTREKVGLWFINPSQEYIGGGPTKTELTGHLDVNPGGLPTLLNMWLGSHYGGTSVSTATNEDWTKVIGPFLIYCNAGASHEAMWHEALTRAAKESAAWPYAWAVDANYPARSERGRVTGQLVLRDAFEPDARMSNVWVGVAAPDYTPPPRQGNWTGGGRRRGGTNAPWLGSTNRTLPRLLNASTNVAATNFPAQPSAAELQRRTGFPPVVDWQRDAKYYQYWVRADGQGRFTIPHVRPGTYTLHAIADGVLGEFTLTNVVVTAGAEQSLGELAWQPSRFGRTVWQVGVPNRAATEFKHGDDYWHWGLYFEYPKEFPKDVDFIIGRSDPRRDWNYVQPPRIQTRDVEVVSEEDENPEAGPQMPLNGLRNVASTTWKIRFELGELPHAPMTLRLAFCGTHQGCNVEVSVNGKYAGETGTLPSTSAMQRDGIRAYWVERRVTFDPAWLRVGENVVELHSAANTWSQGVMYDCVRLEAGATSH